MSWPPRRCIVVVGEQNLQREMNPQLTGPDLERRRSSGRRKLIIFLTTPELVAAPAADDQHKSHHGKHRDLCYFIIN